MIKRLGIIILALSLIMAPMLVTQTVYADEVATQNVITAEEIDALTQKICSELPDRTSYTDACLTAAKAIAGQSIGSITPPDTDLVSYATPMASTSSDYLSSEYLDIEIQEFDTTVEVLDGYNYVDKKVTSYNVVAKTKNFDGSKKTVLITTNFANHYSGNEFFVGTEAEGALGTAATTALTIKLANYLSHNAASNRYNFVFAFFSGTDEGNYGSEAFIDEYLTREVMLVINLEKLGCGKTYYYTDEASTSHGDYIDAFAKSYAVQQFPTAGRVLLPIVTVKDLPYSHYAILGDIAPFLNAEKACLQIMGGDYSKFMDSEGGWIEIVNTSNDTYTNLAFYHPNYATKLSDVSQFVLDLTASEKLGEVCNGAASGYKVFTKHWIAYIIVLVILVALGVILYVVASKMGKKHPLPSPKKIKIAVFGKEFEDFNGDEIIVDIKRKNESDINPFDV
ncbi:MAG: Zn-dependent exopeptidase M28 [Clostridiales bacterium]|nr:Zn-dependent exopeptidase M28 [Clostridiales bacterium]